MPTPLPHDLKCWHFLFYLLFCLSSLISFPTVPSISKTCLVRHCFGDWRGQSSLACDDCISHLSHQVQDKNTHLGTTRRFDLPNRCTCVAVSKDLAVAIPSIIHDSYLYDFIIGLGKCKQGGCIWEMLDLTLSSPTSYSMLPPPPAMSYIVVYRGRDLDSKWIQNDRRAVAQHLFLPWWLSWTRRPFFTLSTLT